MSSKIVVEMSAQEAAMVRSLNRLGMSQEDLHRKVKELERAYNSAGEAGTTQSNKVAKATDAAARARWEEQQAIKAVRAEWAREAEAKKKSGDIGEEAFGSSAIEGLTKYAAGIASIGAAANIARAALQAMYQEREAGAQSILGQVNPKAALAQLAGGDESKFRAMIGAANKSREQVGMNPEQAQRLQFSLESLGLGEARGFFAGFQNIMEDPAAYAEAVGTWQQAFGKSEAGGVREISNKMLAAGAMSKVPSGVFATEMAAPASLAGQVGASDEELAAIGAILTRSSKSASTTATQIRALESTIISRGLAGSGLLGGVDLLSGEVDKIFASKTLSPEDQAAREKNRAIIEDPMLSLKSKERTWLMKNADLVRQAAAKDEAGQKLTFKEQQAFDTNEGLQDRIARAKESALSKEQAFVAKEAELANTGKRVTELFGSVEALTAFENIKKSRADITAAQELIAKSGKVGLNDASMTMQRMVETDPGLRASRELAIQEQKKLIKLEEQYGPDQIMRKAVREGAANESLRNGTPAPMRALENWATGVFDYLGVLPTPMNMQSGPRAGRGSDGFVDAANRMTAAANKLANTANANRPPALAHPDVDK